MSVSNKTNHNNKIKCIGKKKKNFLIVKRTGRDLIPQKDDGYDSSLNKLLSFLNIKIKLGQILF